MKHAVILKMVRLAFLAAPFLTACSLSPVINRDVTDYYRVNDLAANRIILLNILRARDGLPLHFSELSQIRGSLSAGISANTTFPYGSSNGATPPTKMASAGISVSSAPTFDIASLDTQDFTNGVMSPIRPKTIRFFLDEGLDYRMVLMLLTSGIRQAGSNEMILNAPDSSRFVCYKNQMPGKNALPEPGEYSIVEGDTACNPNDQEREYYTFLRILNNIHRLYAVQVKPPPKPVGIPFALHSKGELSTLLQINPKQYTLRYLSTGKYKGKYQLMALSPGTLTVLCRETKKGPQVTSVLSDSGDATVEVPADACNPILAAKISGETTPGTIPSMPPLVRIGAAPGTFVIKLRSTFEVIQYLGEILAFQQRRGACITVFYHDYETPSTLPNQTNKKSASPMTCKGDALFNLVNSSNSGPSSDISIKYGGQKWALPAPRACTMKQRKTDLCDHTLQTMSMISLLLDQNKSAKEIPTTPAVQAVP